MHDTYDIIQPDRRTVGGLLTMRKVADLCEAFHKPCIGHGAFGLAVAGRIQAHAAWGAPLEELALATPPLLPLFRRCLDRLSNRLTKIISEARKLDP